MPGSISSDPKVADECESNATLFAVAGTYVVRSTEHMGSVCARSCIEEPLTTRSVELWNNSIRLENRRAGRGRFDGQPSLVNMV